LDKPVEEAVRSFVLDWPSVSLESKGSVFFKGIGDREVFILGIDDIDTRIVPEGRWTTGSKVEFFKNAGSEVIELGIGLRSFSGYFFRKKPEDFKEPVLDLLGKGVVFRCIMVDPDSSIAKEYAKESGDSDYLDAISRSRERLTELSNEFREMELPGRFDILLHSRIPYFHAVCVDPDLPQGRMYVSHYLYGTRRSEAPGILISRLSNPKLFEKYLTSMRNLIDGCQ